MLSLILSFIAFLVASYFIRRYLDEMEIPRTMTRGIVIFILAAAVSYGVAYLVDLL
jgi:VIT1/CCC1 family predicted Fe2+/Mn2+ transporter